MNVTRDPVLPPLTGRYTIGLMVEALFSLDLELPAKTLILTTSLFLAYPVPPYVTKPVHLYRHDDINKLIFFVPTKPTKHSELF